jgi:PsbP
VTFLINSSYSQSLDNFLNYTNKDMRFTIQHPSKWKVDDDVKGFPDEVWFRSPDSQIRKFAISAEKIEPDLGTDTMTLRNTLQQRAQKQLDEYRSASAHFNLPFTLIRQNEVTVGGNPGWKMEYIISEKEYNLEIFTIANGKFYSLSYAENPLKVPETLPVANKMVESFQFQK